MVQIWRVRLTLDKKFVFYIGKIKLSFVTKNVLNLAHKIIIGLSKIK